MVLIIILIFYMAIQQKCKPFYNDDLNSLEIMSYYILIITSICGILLYNNFLKDHTFLIMLPIIFSNCFFILVLFYRFFKYYQLKVQVQLQKIGKSLAILSKSSLSGSR